MDALYPIAFLGIALTSIFWLFFKERAVSVSFLKGGFVISIFVYLATILLNDGSWIYKILWILPRDLSVLVIAVLAIHRLLKHFKLFLMGLLAFAAFNKFFYFGVMSNSFNFAEGLAPNAELIFEVKSQDKAKMLKVEAILADYEAKATPAFRNLAKPGETLLDNSFALDIPDGEAHRIDDLIEDLQASGLVNWVEENEVLTLSPLEQPEKSQKIELPDLGINDPQVGEQWGFAAMNITEFYKKLKNKKPAKKAKIAILDTGVDSGHEDLKGNYFSVDKGSDSDGNGHGTHCAGIAAAVSNNNLGIASMALNGDWVEVTSIQVLSAGGSGTQQDIINGIMKAADLGVDVISMSLGGYSNDKSQRAYAEAVEYANKAGAIVVVAAGNSDDDAQYYSPANVQGVITVSAVDSDIKKAEFSNTVENIKMAVAAPGVNIYSTYPGNQYKALNGTSMATPYVAGLLGIMKASKPEMDTNKAFEILNKTGIETNDTDLTGKFIQPDKVL